MLKLTRKNNANGFIIILSNWFDEGTSMDGIEGALIETDGRHKIRDISSISIQYEPDVHTALKFLERKVAA